VWRFLWEIVSGVRYLAVDPRSREELRGAGAIGGGEVPIRLTVQGDGGHGDRRERRQPALELSILVVAWRFRKAVTIRVNDDINVVVVSNALAARSSVASLKCHIGEFRVQITFAISRRFAISPRRPCSVAK
jgi:hypothetical protein